jgi:hypothetical protein
MISAVIMSRWLMSGVRYMTVSDVTATAAVVHACPPMPGDAASFTCRAANVNGMSLPHTREPRWEPRERTTIPLSELV